MTYSLTVSGRGNGNFIGFVLTIHSYSYSKTSLTVTVGVTGVTFVYTYTINAGTNYDTSLISQQGNVAYGGITIVAYLTYLGSPPSNSRPSQCLICPEVP